MSKVESRLIRRQAKRKSVNTLGTFGNTALVGGRKSGGGGGNSLYFSLYYSLDLLLLLPSAGPTTNTDYVVQPAARYMV
jgi:hypothetical protein